MGVIFSLSGCKAVGKTTLLNGVKKFMPNIFIREGFRKIDTGFDTSIEEQFYKNERCYIQREIEEYTVLRKSENPVFLLRGAEDVEFYALHYPRIIGKNWDVEKNLMSELSQLRNCGSDYILYLNASLGTILHRKNNDTTKKRLNMQDWLTNWQPFIEPFMKNNAKTTVLDTDKMTAEEVLHWTINWILEKLSESRQM